MMAFKQASDQSKKKKNKAAKRRKDVYANRMDFFLTRKGAAQVMVLVIILTFFIGPMRTIGGAFGSLRDAFYATDGAGAGISAQIFSAKSLLAMAEEKLDAENTMLAAFKKSVEDTEAKINSNTGDFNSVVAAGKGLAAEAEKIYTELAGLSLSEPERNSLDEMMESMRYIVSEEAKDAFNRMAEEYNAKRTASFIGNISGAPVAGYIQ